MTEADMINIIISRTGCTKIDGKEAVRALFEGIATGIALSADGVRLPEIGTARRFATPAKRGRDPRTGEPIDISAGYRVKLTPGTGMKSRLRELAASPQSSPR